MPLWAKTFLLATGAYLAGTYVSDRFIIKYGANDPSGFIDAGDGFGKDEGVVALVSAGLFVIGRKLLGKKGG